MPQNLTLAEYERDQEKRLLVEQLKIGSLIRLRALLHDEVSDAAEVLAEVRSIQRGSPHWVWLVFPEKDLKNGKVPLSSESFALGTNPATGEVVACGYLFAWADLDTEFLDLASECLPVYA